VGWKFSQKKLTFEEHSLHEFIYTQDFAFLFFYIVFGFFVLYYLFFLYKPSKRIKYFQKNEEFFLKQFFGFEDNYYEKKKYYEFNSKLYEKLYKLPIRIGDLFIKVYDKYFSIMHLAIVKLMTGKRVILSEEQLMQNEFEFIRRHNLTFQDYEEDTMEDAINEISSMGMKEEILSLTLTFLFPYRVLFDFPQDQSIPIFWFRNFYLDNFSRNASVNKMLSYFYYEAYLFKGFLSYNNNHKDYLWV
jgi:hypothetical protein